MLALLLFGGVLWTPSSLGAQQSDTDGVVVVCSDAKDRPLEGVEVYLFQCVGLPDGGIDYRSFGVDRSDASGRAKFPVAVTYGGGRYDRLVYARVPGELVGGGRSVRVAPGDGSGSTVAVRLVPSRSLAGKVNVPNGVDGAALRVKVLSMYALDGRQIRDGRDFGTMLLRSSAFPGLDAVLPEVFECRANDAGEFTLHDVPVNARIYLACEGDGLAHAQWANIGPGATALPDRVEIDMALESGLAGQVKTPADDPVAHATVWVRALGGGPARIYVRSEFRTETDALGRFRIGGLPGSELELHIEPKDQQWSVQPRIVTLGIGEQRDGVGIELSPAVVVKGVVLDAESREPIEGASVIALTDTEPSMRIGLSETDPAGRFTLPLPQGAAKIYFAGVPRGYAYPDPQIVATMFVDESSAKTPLRLILKRADQN